MVATYSVGQLLFLRACAALLLLSPLIWRQRAAVPAAGAAAAAAVARRALDAGGRGLLPGDGLSAARRRHHLLSGRSDLRHRVVGDLAGRAGRLAALDRDLVGFCGVLIALRPSAQTVSLAGADRARRQPVVCDADVDHAQPARDARHRAGVVAIHRHVLVGRGAGAVRLGDAEPGSLGFFALAGCISVGALLVRQPLAETRAGERRGAVSVFDDRLGGDVRLSSCSATCRQVATIVGAAIIIGAGLYIFLRERELGREETAVSPPA